MINKLDLSLAIGERSQTDIIDLENNINSYLDMTNIQLSAKVHAAIIAAAKESYIMSLKTIEESISSLLDD